MLVLSRHVYDEVSRPLETVVMKLGDVEVTVCVVATPFIYRDGKCCGSKVRLGFDAPPEVTIHRGEVMAAIQAAEVRDGHQA